MAVDALIQPYATREEVGRGQVIAVSGHHGGRPSLHFSVRIRDVYVDPEPLLVCRGDPGPGLWLR